MSFTNGTTTANNGVFLTVDPNTAWSGRIMLSATLVNGAGPQVAQSAAPLIKLNGTDGNFLDGNVLAKLQLDTPAQVLGALAGEHDRGDIVIPSITIQARSNQITLSLALNGATAACATAIGE